MRYSISHSFTEHAVYIFKMCRLIGRSARVHPLPKGS
jgi:hypothetical protein